MGGLMILIGIIVSTILWSDLNNIYIWIVLFVCTSLGLLGFAEITVLLSTLGSVSQRSQVHSKKKRALDGTPD